ncbi:MAG: hypothetical protein R3325_06135 [Thermoanaerobaculia bacterium]|nr:hypothetical protein [Thermoanaerobaculia bacterium]
MTRIAQRVLTLVALLAWVASAASAGDSQAKAVGVLFFGLPATGGFQLIDAGYDDPFAVYTAEGKPHIRVRPDGIELRRQGTYRIHVEGGLIFDESDPTASDEASALFGWAVGGQPFGVCAFSRAMAIPAVPLLPPGLTIGNCNLTHVMSVQGDGSPTSLAKGTLIQAVVIPTAGPVGDNTSLGVRVEVTRLGK